MLQYILNNLFGRASNVHSGMDLSYDMNPRSYIDKSHPEYQPSLFAAPNVEMLQGASSGAWRTPFMKFMQVFQQSPSKVDSVGKIIKNTGLSKYEAETLKELMNINRFAMRGE